MLRTLLDLAEGSLARFIVMADAAIESAAERGASSLDAEALVSGREAGS